MSKKQKIAVATILVIVLAVIIYWYFVLRNAPTVQAPGAPLTTQGAATTTPPSLGEKIYEQSQNPIQDKVPATQPAVNPIEGAYKNPFE